MVQLDEMDASKLENALTRLGELLEAGGYTYRITLVGGAALNLHGWVERTTDDADILTFADAAPPHELTPAPDPLPPPLLTAIGSVGGDLGLRPDWLNSGPAPQWKTGLPSGFADRLIWRRYGTLHVGLAGRQDLIALKLLAATSRGGRGGTGVDFEDLVQLDPTDAEFSQAMPWVVSQDANEEFPAWVGKVVQDVQRARR